MKRKTFILGGMGMLGVAFSGIGRASELLLPGPEEVTFGLKRQPTLPITETSPVYQLKKSLDASHAVIAAPEDDAQMALAQKVRAALQKAWGVSLEIRPVKSHADGAENVILLGNGMDHVLLRELVGNQQIQRVIKGPELRIFPDALDWKRGVIYVGGRNDAEVLLSVQQLLTLFPQPGNVTFTIKAPPQKLKPPQQYVEEARQIYAGEEAQQNTLVIRHQMKFALDDFRASGDERYVDAFNQMLQLLADHYQDALQYEGGRPPTFSFYMFPQFCYLFENSPKFSDADRRRAGELMRMMTESTMEFWEMQDPIKNYAAGKSRYLTNHYNYACRSVADSARYLLSRYEMSEMKYFLAVAENTLNANKAVPLGPEDAGGYQYMVNRIYNDYMLSTGELTHAYFASESYQHLMDFAKMSMNHLGYTPSYGDVDGLKTRGNIHTLHDNMDFTGDADSAALLSLMGRTAEAGFYSSSIRDWDIPFDLPLPQDPRLWGLRLFTVDAVRAQLMGMIRSPRPQLDKAFLRSSWNPQNAEFLAVNGINDAPHGHADATGICQFIKGQHLWIFETDYIRKYAEHHNMISVIRDGQAAQRQHNAIPDKERFAQVIGSAQSADHQAAVLSLLLESNNGVDYYRHICWAADRGFWVIDELEATQAGNYRFSSRWRTTGEIAQTAQGVLVTQQPAAPDDSLNHFAIAEGSGAVHIGYSELERGHSAGTGNLASYPHSDQITRTVMFWKDAQLAAGQKVLFAQYSRVIPGNEPQPMPVQQLAENAFGVGAGKERQVVVIGSFKDVSARALFAGAHGTLAIEPRRTDAADVAKVLLAPGKVLSNAEITAPQNANTVRLNVLHQLEAAISACASGDNFAGVGLANGAFYLFKPDGAQQAKVQLEGEVTAINCIATPQGQQWAVGTRPANNAANAPGYLHLIDANGKVLWKKTIAANRGRQGTPRTIFQAHLDGRDKPVSIIMGPESWRYAAFDLNGKQRWILNQRNHGGTVGVAGDLDGDGKDEVFIGAEYYTHEIVSSSGKVLKHTTTAPWNEAAVIGDPGNKGALSVFAARSDGFLYSESLQTEKAPDWSANLGGPAYGLVLQEGAIAAATLNGIITRLDANGKRLNYTQLPAPLTDLLAQDNYLFAPGRDGRIYQLSATQLELQQVWETAGYAESDLYRPQLCSSAATVFAVLGKCIYRLG